MKEKSGEESDGGTGGGTGDAAGRAASGRLRFDAQPDERAISGTERLWFALGGGSVLQRVETDDGFDVDFTQAKSTLGRSRLQGAGLYPPPLGETMQSTMFSTEQC